jgi:hypothetical protein
MTQPRAHDARLFDRRRWRWERPRGPATAVSIALHVLLLVFTGYALRVPEALNRILSSQQQTSAAREQLRYVTVDSGPRSPLTPIQSRRPERAAAPAAEPAPPLVAPREIPTELPPLPADTAARSATRPLAGPLGGGAGPSRRALPTYSDPRVWVADPPLVYAPKTDEARLDSALAATLGRYRDSLVANTYSPNKFERGDWTVERDGQKWGIDQHAIRLGRLSIPTALLGLLPLNQWNANPIAVERDRAMMSMRSDILYHAQGAMNEEQFRKAVRAIRDRKERERRAAQNPRSPGPVVSPGDRPPND